MQPGVFNGGDNLPTRRSQRPAKPFLERSPVTADRSAHGLHPSGDVLPAIGRRRVHVVEYLSNILHRRCDRIEIAEGLSRGDRVEFIVEEFQSHSLGQSIPSILADRHIEKLLSISKKQRFPLVNAVRAEVVPQMIETPDADEGRFER